MSGTNLHILPNIITLLHMLISTSGLSLRYPLFKTDSEYHLDSLNPQKLFASTSPKPLVHGNTTALFPHLKGFNFAFEWHNSLCHFSVEEGVQN